MSAIEQQWPTASCCGEPRVTRHVDRCYDHAKVCAMCGEPSEDGTCPACQLARAVSLDDPKLVETLARVIENRHGTLHGIGSTLREALDEFKRYGNSE